MKVDFDKIYDKCSKLSLLSKERLLALSEAVDYVVRNNIPGGIVECGVYRGGSALCMLLTLEEIGDISRSIYLYDTFAGMSRPTEKDVDCEASAAAEVNWRYCRMAGKQIIRSDLKKANLNTTILSRANLFASDLSGANASYTDFSLANLSFTNFTNASLKGANLQRADLTQANLTNVDLSYADLRDAILTRVHFEKTRLDKRLFDRLAAGSHAAHPRNGAWRRFLLPELQSRLICHLRNRDEHLR